MRIISGTLKRKSINFLKNLKTRPPKDSVRENIFNILKHSNLIKTNIECSKVLDLYSGSGSFGIESISRGAQSVTFIEQDQVVCNVLKNNLIKLSIINKSKIYMENIDKVLSNINKEKFNIFFLDPPFSDLNYLKTIELLKNNNMFETNHIVIIHREKNSNDDFKNLLKIIQTKKYGRSKIIFGMLK